LNLPDLCRLELRARPAQRHPQGEEGPDEEPRCLERAVGRSPAGTRTHDDGGLSDAQPGALGDDQGLDGVAEVLGRVLVGEELDRFLDELLEDLK